MADRTSAALFRFMFEQLAEEPSERGVEIAQALWEKAAAYDFSPCQMDCDDALAALGLAREHVAGDVRCKGEEGFEE